MNKEKRKNLKKQGKAAIEKQSAELREKLRESNPASFSDPTWAKNYKQISLKEHEYKNNRRTVYPGSYIGIECLLNPVDMDLSKNYLPIQGYYLHCSSCNDLVPMDPEINLSCKCGSIRLYPDSQQAEFDPANVQVAKLIGKASLTKKKWWQFWWSRLTRR